MSLADRVRSATNDEVQRRLDQERLQRVADMVEAPPSAITERIEEIDKTWDVERVLEANASTLMLVSLALSRLHSRRWLWLSAIVPTFLLQHAIQGWCPPIEAFRRMGIRTRRELDVERTALKILRGDFDEFDRGADDQAAAHSAIDAAERRSV